VTSDGKCKLCGSDVLPWVETAKQRYFRCPHCELVRKETFPAAEHEKARYEEHNNDPLEARYRNHVLSLLESDLLPYAEESAALLDYGCGPSAAVAVILADIRPDMLCDSYDPYFFPSEPDGEYDLIYCNEVVEHMFEPGRNFRRMAALMPAGGNIVLGTHIYPADENEFRSWWYTRDLSHVHFFSRKSMEIAAEHIGGRYHPGVSPTMNRISIG
jgi:hypothetical protein